MEREHFEHLAQKASDKKNHSEFSIFWDIINSWLDIQTGLEKKNVLGRKKSCIKQNSEHKNTKSNNQQCNKPGVYKIYYLPNLF